MRALYPTPPHGASDISSWRGVGCISGTMAFGDATVLDMLQNRPALFVFCQRPSYCLSDILGRNVLTRIVVMLHIGQIIKQEFDRQPKSVTVIWLAQKLNCRRNNVYDIFRRPTIDTQLLERISRALNHNFFADIAEALDKEDVVL